MADHHRDPDAGRFDLQVRDLEDLPALVDQLPFLVGVSLFVLRPGERQDVPTDRPRIEVAAGIGPPAADQGIAILAEQVYLAGKLVDSSLTRSGHRLVRGRHHPLQTRRSMKRARPQPSDAMVVQLGLEMIPRWSAMA